MLAEENNCLNIPDTSFSILSFLNDIVVCIDFEGRISEINNAGERFYGWERESVLGKNFLKLCEEFGYDYPAIEKGTSFKMPMLTQIKLSAGGTHAASWQIITNEQLKKQNIAYCFIGCDVTSLRESENKARGIEMQLQSLIQLSTGNHWWKDKEGRYLGCNDALAIALHLKSHKDILGKTDYDLPWFSTADELVRTDQEVMNTGKTIRTEELVANKEGKLLTFIVVKSPLCDERGNIVGTIGSSTDITELKYTQKLLQEAKEQADAANQAKSSFLASISHELRTPLNGILGVADLLSRQNLNIKQKAMLENIISSGKNLLAIVNDILDLSKLEAGKLRLSHKSFELDKLLKGIYRDMSPLVGDAVKLTVHYDSSLPEKLVGDSLRLRQVLVNLISNAIKFTEKGSIEVRVTCESKQNDSVGLYFSVSDTGIGIPEDKLTSIFERFNQVEAEFSEYQRRYGGTGLGLSICKHLLGAMNGEIGVESILGEGSTFWFRLSLSISSEFIDDSSQRTSVDIVPFNQSHYVLLVEDDPVNQFVAKGMLEEFSCLYDLAQDGNQALTLFQKNPEKYELILMDIRLPDMTGMAVTKKLRAMQSEGEKCPPIVAMTAHAFEEEIREFHKAGMVDIVTKPIHRDVFYTILKRYLEKTS